MLIAILNSLKYDYQPGEEPEAFHFFQEDIPGLLQTKQGFLEEKTPARPWKEIKHDLRRA